MKATVKLHLKGRDAASFIAGDQWTPVTVWNFMRSLKLLRTGSLRDEDGVEVGIVEVEEDGG